MDADETLAGETHASAPKVAPARELVRGDLVGRFVVLERRGSGSMGMVYGAYDPELDRRVALKILRRRDRDGGGGDERRRVLREAQALARLNDPNVITIHDVGEHEGRVFLAMEFVDGPTLTQWLAAARRGLAEILAKFVDAGRGLAAAHDKGLVHRDFKPDNVMLDDQGRVRVLDFGLVRAADDRATSDPVVARDPATAPTTDALGTDASREGRIVGTPAYMAPEQLAGTLADARSDQFSYCVALYEAVYGERPFVGRDVYALSAAITAGVVAAPRGGHAVPAWLRRVILRGLAVARDDRWPDMHALVGALSYDHAGAVRRRRRMVGAGVVVVGLAGGLWAVRELPRARCEDEASPPGLWDEARRAELERAMVADDGAFRRRTWEETSAILDARAQSLHGAAVSACLAAPSDPVAASRHLCVARHRRELDATITALFDADADAMVVAVGTATAIPDAAACSDPLVLARELQPPPPAIAASVQAQRDDIARARAAGRLGHFDAALSAAEQVLSSARALGYRPLVAESLAARGKLFTSLVRPREAEPDLVEAFTLFVEGGDDRGALEAAVRLTFVVGDQGARPGEGLVWGQVARALLGRGDSVEAEVNLLSNLSKVHDRRGDPRLALAELEHAMTLADRAGTGGRSEMLRTLGDFHRELGDVASAERVIEEALALDREELGDEHPFTAADLTALGSVYLDRGESTVALEHYRSALATLERALGPDSERLTTVLSNIGTTLGRRGELDDARAAYERSLAISRANLGADHPNVLEGEANLATLLYMGGDAAGARTRHLALLPMVERRLGPEHPFMMNILNNLASAELALGEHAEALGHLERSLAISDGVLGKEHVDSADIWHSMGEVELASGHPEQALARFERALALYERHRGVDHLHVSWPLLGIGRAAVALGDHEGAIAALERSFALRGGAEVSPVEKAEVGFALAAALWIRPAERTRARALASGALAQIDADPALRTDPELHAEIVAWLRDHAAP